jgi:hypothetical protein
MFCMQQPRRCLYQRKNCCIRHSGRFYRNQDLQAAASEREENHMYQLNNIQTQNAKSWNIIDS